MAQSVSVDYRTIEASTTWVHNVKFGHFYLKTLWLIFIKSSKAAKDGSIFLFSKLSWYVYWKIKIKFKMGDIWNFN